ncbi:MAG: helix-turn-helix transcriptional regulator [Bacteroidales bacterium]|nr:helix-turn-helix transcriptional regulator [Bacteroidales bacterium]
MEKILVKNVKQLCKEQDMPLKNLALKIGMDAGALTRALYGNPKLETMEKIARALSVSVADLLTEAEQIPIEGYIKVYDNLYHISSRNDIQKIIKIIES